MPTPGLQKQRQAATGKTVEDELDRAIYLSGGMLESNYGDLSKVKWSRSSRTDKGKP
jgi:tRNA pseudouridine38-40 synthase